MIPASLTQDATVRMRTQHWVVQEVERTLGVTTVSLASGDDDAEGEESAVVWEAELDSEVLEDESWKKIGQQGFEGLRHFAAYLDTLRWNALVANDSRLFEFSFHARIGIDPRQLDPLSKVPRLPLAVLLGRPSVHGLQGRRLHEQLLTVASRWSPPQGRANPLSPFPPSAGANTMEVLRVGHTPGISKETCGRIRQLQKSSIPQDTGDRLSNVQPRREETMQDASVKSRAEIETGQPSRSLEEQRKGVSENIVARRGRD